MTILEYVKKTPGHRNSQGEPAPWTIVSHKTGKVLSSHKTKEDAEEHLRHMHIFKESANMDYGKSLVYYVKFNDNLGWLANGRIPAREMDMAKPFQFASDALDALLKATKEDDSIKQEGSKIVECYATPSDEFQAEDLENR